MTTFCNYSLPRMTLGYLPRSVIGQAHASGMSLFNVKSRLRCPRGGDPRSLEGQGRRCRTGRRVGRAGEFSEERVAMPDASPTVRQRELGLRLRKLRTSRGLTVEEVAEKLMCSAAKVSRLETGARRPVPRDVRELCELCSLDEAMTSELMRLTRQAREQGWWTQYEDLGL